jgi:hypothetical protein
MSLGAARALESQEGSVLPNFATAKHVSDERFFLKSQHHSDCYKGQFWWLTIFLQIQKLSVLCKRLRIITPM